MFAKTFRRLVTMLFLLCATASIADPYLVKDINPGSGQGAYSAMGYINDVLIFACREDVYVVLCKSDGTADGTVVVKSSDLLRNVGSAAFTTLEVGNEIFFSGYDPVNGDNSLWKTDGTDAGTVKVKGSISATQLTNVNGTIFFRLNNELWKSDGTEPGTVLVKDIRPGSIVSELRGLTNINGSLYFMADDGVHGYEPWKSDGTEIGTVMIRDVYPGSYGSGTTGFHWFIAFNGLAFFSAQGQGVPGFGVELWQTDGTELGTLQVKDINPGVGSSRPSLPTIHNGLMYFNATDGANGFELWKSDGTTGGTVLVKDIRPGSIGSQPFYLTSISDTLYFSANDGAYGRELWKSDGTELGTVMVKDISSAVGSTIEQFMPINDTLYFSPNDIIHGYEFWNTDGTDAGTVMIMDINPGSGSSTPNNFLFGGDTLFFIADNGTSGWELWALAGVINPDPPGNSSSNPAQGNQPNADSDGGGVFGVWMIVLLMLMVNVNHFVDRRCLHLVSSRCVPNILGNKKG